MFQVVGSTPESIRDSVKTSGLKSNAGPAMKVAAASLFASAVNKSTLEGFIAKPTMQDARGIVLNSFSISGRTNMTGMTLLGHCLLTTDFAGEVNFAREFRKKMGQNHLWDGELNKGSLSDKQREIMLEKKRVTVEASARLLGSGFLKFTGIEKVAMTSAEAAFWGEIDQSAVTGLGSGSGSGQPVAPSSHSRGASSSSSNTRLTPVNVSSTNQVMVPEDVVNYYNKYINTANDPYRLANSVDKKGVEAFVSNIRQIMAKSPDGRGLSSGGSTLG